MTQAFAARSAWSEEIDAEARVLGDAAQLRQACWNLVLNASQAMGGRAGEVTVGVQAMGSEVEIDVEDEGPGISVSDLPHLFEPFFTTKEGGTGLGLSTVQAIVRGHGGTLAVLNRDPHGARFSIRLPSLTSLSAHDGTSPTAATS